jgi:hypothetical protein
LGLFGYIVTKASGHQNHEIIISGHQNHEIIIYGHQNNYFIILDNENNYFIMLAKTCKTAEIRTTKIGKMAERIIIISRFCKTKIMK